MTISLVAERSQERALAEWVFMNRHSRAYFACSQKSLIKEEWQELLEILSSFCRDLILVKENSQERLLMNPDYESEIRKAEKQVSEKHLQELLGKVDYSMYGLQKNFNLSLLISSFFLDFKDLEYV